MEKKIIISILTFFVVVLAAIAVLRFFSGPEDVWLCVNNQWVKHGQPAAAMPTGGCGSRLIGEQKDEHGCLAAAGFTWCPSTNRCQRMWQEYCTEYKAQFRSTSTAITNFAECAAAGNPVRETYPRQCAVNDQVFAEDVGGNPNIYLASPLPKAIITSPLTIKGEARGSWYFEAVFPIKLEDANGDVLAQTQAHAQGDWMSNKFVPFTAKLTFNSGTTTKGFLILAKDNPSGLQQNDDSLKVPVSFK